MLIVASVAVLAGCSSDNPSATAPKDEPKLASKSAAVEGTLDPGHPDELPLWAGATVVSSTLPGEGVYDLELSTTDAMEEVVYGVGEGLKAEGYTVEELEGSDVVTAFLATKGELAVIYTITPSDAGVTISVAAQLPLP